MRTNRRRTVLIVCPSLPPARSSVETRNSMSSISIALDEWFMTYYHDTFIGPPPYQRVKPCEAEKGRDNWADERGRCSRISAATTTNTGSHAAAFCLNLRWLCPGAST